MQASRSKFVFLFYGMFVTYYAQASYTLSTNQSSAVMITTVVKNDQSKLTIDGMSYASGVPYLIQLPNSPSTQKRTIKIQVSTVMHVCVGVASGGSCLADNCIFFIQIISASEKDTLDISVDVVKKTLQSRVDEMETCYKVRSDIVDFVSSCSGTVVFL